MCIRDRSIAVPLTGDGRLVGRTAGQRGAVRVGVREAGFLAPWRQEGSSEEAQGPDVYKRQVSMMLIR